MTPTREPAMIILTADARVGHWSPSATRLFGWSADEATGDHLAKLLGLGGTKPFMELGVSLADAEAWEGELCVRRRDGLQFLVRVSTTPVVDASGRQVSVVRVAGDPPEALQATLKALDSKRTDGVLRRLSAVMESSIDAILTTTVDGTITTWNASAERIYGYSTLEAVGQHVSLLVPPSRLGEVKNILTQAADGRPVDQLKTVRLHKHGHEIDVLVSVWALVDDDGAVVGTCGLTHDISDQILQSRALEAADIKFQAAFDQSAVGLVISNLNGWPTAVNPAICRILGRRPEELIGRPWMEYAPPHPVPVSEEGLARLRQGAFSYDVERQYIRPDGSTVWLQVNVHTVKGANDVVEYFMAHMQDITERKLMEQELQFRALHDDLTGLPNRSLLSSRLDEDLDDVTPTGGSIGLAFLDIDGFKHINDALGHSVGDQLLVELGHRLRETVNAGDTVARFGGDEFVVVCKDVTVDMMTGLAAQISEAMARPFSISGREVALRASFGITLSRLDSTSNSLLSEADAAMYRAKELGRGLTVVFDDSLRRRAELLIEGERALAAAIDAGDLVPFYQPIVELATGRPVGVEALARWVTSDGRVLSPADFIPLAESTGLVIGLGEQILSQAACATAAWNAVRRGVAPLWVSVNISAAQLIGTDVVKLVRDVLRTSGLSAELLHLEITETVAMEHVDHSIATLNQLKELGVRLSIDDFGTGYNSLAYLQQLPFDVLKIDGSFVQTLGAEPHDALIIKAVVSLAEALGMSCIAEGVETEEQRRDLVELGCQFGQGYLWSRPLGGSEAAKWATDSALSVHLAPGSAGCVARALAPLPLASSGPAPANS